MFCENCGSHIKDNDKFCPQCGNRIEEVVQTGAVSLGVEMPVDYMYPMGQPDQNGEQLHNDLLMSGGDQKKMPASTTFVILIIGVIALIGGLLFLGEKEENNEEYSIVGEWQSQDLVDLEDIFIGILEENDITGWVAESAISVLGLDKLGELTLTFTPSGNIYMGVDGISISVGSFTYEELGNGKMMLVFDLSDVTVYGFSLPISVSYTATYSVDKYSMTLDLFGYPIKFNRM